MISGKVHGLRTDIVWMNGLLKILVFYYDSIVFMFTIARRPLVPFSLSVSTKGPLIRSEVMVFIVVDSWQNVVLLGSYKYYFSLNTLKSRCFPSLCQHKKAYSYYESSEINGHVIRSRTVIIWRTNQICNYLQWDQ